MLDDDKARDFIHAYLDGQLSDDEAQQLNVWIKHDPDNMREVLQNRNAARSLERRDDRAK